MHSRSSSSKRPTVVLAHPHSEMQAFLREQLVDRYRALVAGGPREAWRQVREEEPDLLVADAGLSEPGGRALCRKVKEAPAVGPVSVLLLTGDATDSFEATDSSEEDPAEERRPGDDAALESAEQRPAHPFVGEARPSPGPDQCLEKPFSAAVLRRQVERLLGGAGAVETVLRLINRWLGDPTLTVEDLSEAVDLSRRHLTRRLKEETGQAPAALLRQRRIEAAKRHLKAEAGTIEGGTIKEVAEAVGFRSPSHFSQVFRKGVGQTPSAYRDQHASR